MVVVVVAGRGSNDRVWVSCMLGGEPAVSVIDTLLYSGVGGHVFISPQEGKRRGGYMSIFAPVWKKIGGK